MIIDQIDLTLEAGHGGPGKVSFCPGLTSGPDGGNGGKGGDVYIRITTDLGALNRYTSNRKIKAENGFPGQPRKMYGRDGKDITIEIPKGSTLEDTETGEKIELFEANEVIMICQGGLGGRGNFEFRSSTNTTPRYAQSGLPGEKRLIHVNLRFLAEYGLIGLPNAGKSSLLNSLTNAKAVIGSYPFTTLEPNLGAIDQHIIADLPGLIEGASQGKGLGIKFLKHIDKVKILIHCITAESDDVVKDYKTIVNELKQYNPELIEKKQILVITKSDLVEPERIIKIQNELKPYKHPIVVTSTLSKDGINTLYSLLTSTNP